MDPVEDLLEPHYLASALDASPDARIAWDSFPPPSCKQMLWWVITAAKPDTRARRISRIVIGAAHDRRAQG
jgi:uncharacterized protein YdeI (YjbR/CyaY-like superfamily)